MQESLTHMGGQLLKGREFDRGGEGGKTFQKPPKKKKGKTWGGGRVLFLGERALDHQIP